MGRCGERASCTAGQEVPQLGPAAFRPNSTARAQVATTKTRARVCFFLRAPGSCSLFLRYRYLVEPLRQLDMKVLRSSPFRLFAAASLLHAVIFSCCVILAGAAAAVPLRQLDINVLRASPFKVLVVACALQSFIFCCWAACAALGCLVVSCATAGTATAASIARASMNEILR